jgi:hypothetical protein
VTDIGFVIPAKGEKGSVSSVIPAKAGIHLAVIGIGRTNLVILLFEARQKTASKKRFLRGEISW